MANKPREEINALNRQRENRRIYGELIQSLDKEKASTHHPGQLALETGKFFLGTPYRAGTLETNGDESLAVNLREMDCTTFVENVIALTRHMNSRRPSFEEFQRFLQRIRYRQGRLQGYSSRLHYFSDWIHDNQKKGIVRDVTSEIGGRPERKTVKFMTVHPGLYPALKDKGALQEMRSVEMRISRRSRFFIPVESVRRMEDRIEDGDLIAITTNAEGLDVQHVGFAVKVRHRIHLLHASGKEGRVVISRETLYRSLTRSKTRSGIMVARIC